MISGAWAKGLPAQARTCPASAVPRLKRNVKKAILICYEYQYRFGHWTWVISPSIRMQLEWYDGIPNMLIWSYMAMSENGDNQIHGNQTIGKMIINEWIGLWLWLPQGQLGLAPSMDSSCLNMLKTCWKHLETHPSQLFPSESCLLHHPSQHSKLWLRRLLMLIGVLHWRFGLCFEVK